jgi:hypothetical protein
MPSTDKPAGFFSTFSILDPNGTHEGNPRAQKRNRRVFVCIPCHRRKLKCDKGQPCSRCTQSGAGDECVYQALPSTNSISTTVKQEPTTPEPRKQSKSPPKGGARPQDRTQSSYRVSDGKARVSGSTHWAKIACEVSWFNSCFLLVRSGTACFACQCYKHMLGVGWTPICYQH